MIKVLVSSCLLGERVRYHGGDAQVASGVLDRWQAEGRLVPVCPELAGGLPVPRPPAEIAGGDGDDVLGGRVAIGDSTGADVTGAFMLGARRTLDLARECGARLAVLKDGSPSCATTFVHDGTFRGQRNPGRGLTSALLAANGIRLFNERQIAEAEAYLASLEDPAPVSSVVKPPAFECVVPILRVRSLALSLEHYVSVLGFRVDWQEPGAMASVSRDGHAIMLCEGGQGQPGTWVWIGVEDVERLHAEYAGRARIRLPPTRYPWAYEMQVEDPDGHVLRMGSEPRTDPPGATPGTEP